MAKRRNSTLRALLPKAVIEMFRNWGRTGGTKGGRARSAAKARAARNNGRKGGRPRKKKTRR